MSSLSSVGGKLYSNGEEVVVKDTTSPRVAIVDFGTVSNNTRTVLPNPFGNENATLCIVRAEVQDITTSVWYETGVANDSGSGTAGYGTRGHSLEEGIAVVTGVTALNVTMGRSLSGIDTSVNMASAPCRVIVTYFGELS